MANRKGRFVALVLCSAALAGACSPAATTGASRTATIGAVIRLWVHDEQGVALAHQAQAQSGSPEIRSLAGRIAVAHQAEADMLGARLDAAAVPVADRFDVAAVGERPASAFRCDVAPDDEVAVLADADGPRFDHLFRSLILRHLAGGDALADVALAGAEQQESHRVLRDLRNDLLAEAR
jgi:uncharacterized protein (DUF305 family)